MILILIPSGYWVGKYEVTQEQYLRVMETNPSLSRATWQPVENVTWNNAMDFCRRLTGLEMNAGTLPSGAVYTLPTEKQWEEFWAQAKFTEAVTSRDRPRDSAAVVGSASSANRFGLFDVVGNVWEWCLDGPNAQKKVLKGGSYSTRRTLDFKPVMETTPWQLSPASRARDAGFRCVLLTQS
jgi:formylglycine-generating enzyme required for sulfatase activity